MAENYTEGDLGEIFEKAVPLPLPVVSRLLDQLANSVHQSDRTGELEGHSALLQRCREQINVLEEACGTEEVVEMLRAVRLRLRQVRDATNAHLAYYLEQQQEAEFNEPGEGGFLLDLGGGEGSNADQFGGLHAFEIVAITTLMPKTAEEGILLVPSLSRFEPEELEEKVIRVLES